jgi:protein-S-isoprenylcysteine O-methyltransferase Ste14
VVLPWAVTGFVILASILSAVFYRHGGRRYAIGKSETIASARGFRWVYRYLQLSTILVAVAPQWSDHTIWIKLFSIEWLTLTGLVIASLGLAVFIWAKCSLGQAYSPCFDSLVPQSLVNNGPYRWVRHPIYTGNLLLLLGLFLASGSLWLVMNTAILAAYYYRAAVDEERALSNQFPEYAGLLARTGRFLPRLIFGSS